MSAFDSSYNAPVPTYNSNEERQATFKPSSSSTNIVPPSTNLGAYDSFAATSSVSMSGFGREGQNGNLGATSGAGSGAIGVGTMAKQPSMGARWKDKVKNMKAEAKQDYYKVYVVKSTNHEMTPPKPKYIQQILSAIQQGGSISNRNSPVGGIFYHLRKRLSEKNWVVVTKALTIWHLIFREGNNKFVEYVAKNARGMFATIRVWGDSDAQRAVPFINAYSKYLTQWCAMKAYIDFPAGKAAGENHDPNVLKKYIAVDKDVLFREIPVLIDTLDILMTVNLQAEITATAMTLPTIAMVLKDFTYLWNALTDALANLIDKYFSMNHDTDAPIALELYQKYGTILPRGKEYLKVGKSIYPQWVPPNVDLISMDLEESMKTYIKDGPAYQHIQAAPDDSASEPEVDLEPDYYEPPPDDYYSASDPEEPYDRYPHQIPPPQQQPPPRPSRRQLSTSSDSESESESSSSQSQSRSRQESESESESESAKESSSESEKDKKLHSALPMPQVSNKPKQFDPLSDLLGIESGPSEDEKRRQQQLQLQAQMNQMMLYQTANKDTLAASGIPMGAFNQTSDDRINQIKAMLNQSAPPPINNINMNMNPQLIQQPTFSNVNQLALAQYKTQLAAGGPMGGTGGTNLGGMGSIYAGMNAMQSQQLQQLQQQQRTQAMLQQHQLQQATVNMMSQRGNHQPQPQRTNNPNIQAYNTLTPQQQYQMMMYQQSMRNTGNK